MGTGSARQRRPVALFVAVWPTPAVVGHLATLARPECTAVRWTSPERLHITLLYLGAGPGGGSGGEGAAGEDTADADGGVRADLTEAAVERLGRFPVVDHAGTVARLGRATGCFGRSILHVPVSGLDALARAARAVFTPGPWDSPDGSVDRTPFAGHVTIGRARSRGDVRSCAGMDTGPASGLSWPVGAVTLVASVPTDGRTRYDVVRSVDLPLRA